MPKPPLLSWRASSRARVVYTCVALCVRENDERPAGCGARAPDAIGGASIALLRTLIFLGETSLPGLYNVSGYLLLLAHAGPAAWAVYHALLYKRDPRSAAGWIIICLFVPLAGPLAYFLLGINRVRSRAQALHRPFYVVEYEGAARASRDKEPHRSKSAFDFGERITGRAASPGNEVTMLHNGDMAYPAMLEAIESAHERVLLSAYIFKRDRSGTAFADALEAAVRRGVESKVLIDGFGELYARRRVAAWLEDRGIAVARFLPPRLVPSSMYINLRNHRKILVVDDDLAFAGGINISDENASHGAAPRSITDVHFRFRGPIAPELARVFWNDWHFATHEARATPEPRAVPARGPATCRVVPDGPDAGLDTLALTIQAAIGSASRTIDIMTPYFVPGRDLLAALLSAALRGVRVRIVLPEKNNLPYVHWASQNTLTELLRWNTLVYYQPPPFCHSKLLCVDDEYSMIGSANLDARSLRLNFEIGVEVFSSGLGADIRQHFDRVIEHSAAVTYDELARRSVMIRLRDSAAALMSPYL